MTSLDSAAPALTPAAEVLAAEVRAGLAVRPRRLPQRWLFDARGEALFQELCEAPEHPLRRAEAALLERHRAELSELAGASAASPAVLSGTRVGELDPADLVDLLRRLRERAAPGALLVLGVDLPRAPDALVAAYDDAGGAARAFHLNALARMNRELGANFRLGAFRYEASWEPSRSRVERWLVSTEDQVVLVAGEPHVLRQGEAILAGRAYKWEPRAIDALAAMAGWDPARTFTDERAWYALQAFVRR